MSFLEQTFRLSQGEPRAQIAAFMWAQKNGYLHVQKTLRNFEDTAAAQGWNFLNDQEKANFKRAYSAIHDHGERIENGILEGTELFKSIVTQTIDIWENEKQEGTLPEKAFVEKLTGKTFSQMKHEVSTYATTLRENKRRHRSS